MTAVTGEKLGAFNTDAAAVTADHGSADRAGSVGGGHDCAPAAPNSRSNRSTKVGCLILAHPIFLSLL